MVTAGEFCNRRVVTIGRKDSVIEAARRMRANYVGSLVVVEQAEGKVTPVGIVTDRDIVVGVVARASSYLQSLRVEDILAEPLVTSREQESVVDALKTMRKNGIRRMPVVNEQGGLEGILAFDDMLEFLSEELADLAALVSREQRLETERRT